MSFRRSPYSSVFCVRLSCHQQAASFSRDQYVPFDDLRLLREKATICFEAVPQRHGVVLPEIDRYLLPGVPIHAIFQDSGTIANVTYSYVDFVQGGVQTGADQIQITFNQPIVSAVLWRAQSMIDLAKVRSNSIQLRGRSGDVRRMIRDRDFELGEGITDVFSSLGICYQSHGCNRDIQANLCARCVDNNGRRSSGEQESHICLSAAPLDISLDIRRIVSRRVHDG